MNALLNHPKTVALIVSPVLALGLLTSVASAYVPLQAAPLCQVELPRVTVVAHRDAPAQVVARQATAPARVKL